MLWYHLTEDGITAMTKVVPRMLVPLLLLGALALVLAPRSSRGVQTVYTVPHFMCVEGARRWAWRSTPKTGFCGPTSTGKETPLRMPGFRNQTSPGPGVQACPAGMRSQA
jgi:hypothetical protein